MFFKKFVIFVTNQNHKIIRKIENPLSVMETITEKTKKIIDSFIPEGKLNAKVNKLLIDDIKRKLTEFELINRHCQKKYGVTFTEFEQKNIIKEKGYSFEVETDYHEWDAAIDTINTLKSHLNDLK